MIERTGFLPTLTIEIPSTENLKYSILSWFKRARVLVLLKTAVRNLVACPIPGEKRGRI